jgi:hypothetical protein
MGRTGRLLLWVLGTRVVAGVAMVLGSFFPAAKDDPTGWLGHDGDFYWRQVPIRVLDVWGRWDTFFYWGIARDGYPAPEGPGVWMHQAAFFPLFPSLMRGLSTLLGGLDTYYCGLLLAQVMLVGAVVYFDKLLRLDEKPELSALAVSVLLTYPGSHFLSCVYPESTALFLAVFATYCARVGKFWVAGLAAALAVLARSSGVFVAVLVLLELLRGDDGRLKLRPRVLVLLLCALPVLFMLGLHQSIYGDPLYFIHVQAGWPQRKASVPFMPLFDGGLSFDYHLFTLWALATTVYAWKRNERLSYKVLATLNVLLPLSAGTMRGIHRYMGGNFPLFLFVARFVETRRWAKWAWYAVGLTVMAIFAFQWGRGRHPN